MAATETKTGRHTDTRATSIGASAAERHGHEGLSPTLQRTFDAPDSATCQLQVVEADEHTTFDAILTTDLSRSRIVMSLSWLRALPERVAARLRGREFHPDSADPTVAGLIEAGYWIVLERRPPKELALGLSMWDPEIEADGLSSARFHEATPGAVRVGWSFCVERLSPTRSLLITETRAQGVDEKARRRFRRYWRLISPFANLTRRLVLRSIAEEAEHRARSGRVTDGAASVGAPQTKSTEQNSTASRPARLRHGLPRTELERIAADPSNPLHDAAEHRLAIRQRRDEMCGDQLAWEDFDIPGELGHGTSTVSALRAVTL